MGADRAADPAGEARRTAARGERPGGRECDLLRALDRLPVAGAAQGSAAEEHGSFLYFSLWDWDGTLERIHHALYVETREREGREASPTAPIIDSQSGKAAQKGAPRSTRRAIDAGKKVTGRKRHILVDTLGLLLSVVGPSGRHAGSRRCRRPAAPMTLPPTFIQRGLESDR